MQKTQKSWNLLRAALKTCFQTEHPCGNPIRDRGKRGPQATYSQQKGQQYLGRGAERVYPLLHCHRKAERLKRLNTSTPQNSGPQMSLLTVTVKMQALVLAGFQGTWLNYKTSSTQTTASLLQQLTSQDLQSGYLAQRPRPSLSHHQQGESCRSVEGQRTKTYGHASDSHPKPRGHGATRSHR